LDGRLQGGQRVQQNQPQLNWVRSEFCGTGACVEAAQTADDSILLRNSTDPTGPVLTFKRSEWDAFVAGVRAGNFDSGPQAA
jgi:hypothetical protein